MKRRGEKGRRIDECTRSEEQKRGEKRRNVEQRYFGTYGLTSSGSITEPFICETGEERTSVRA